MTRALTLFIVLAASTVPAAAAGSSCSRETLPVEGSAVTIGYCVAGPLRASGAEVIVPVTATYSTPAASVTRSTNLHFLSGEGVSRMIESLDLAKLGLAGTLHLTLAYSRGLVRVEGALLTPGAITIK